MTEPNQLHRRSIRLRAYDYSVAGAYFITLCTHNRVCRLGEIVDGSLHSSDEGRVVTATWDALPQHYPHVSMDAFVIMPNHVHGIVVLADNAPAPAAAPAAGLPKRHGLPEIVRALKAFSARGINAMRGTPGCPVWQRNYYEHVVRGQDDLDRLRRYVLENPARWSEDRENPVASRAVVPGRAGYDGGHAGGCEGGHEGGHEGGS